MSSKETVNQVDRIDDSGLIAGAASLMLFILVLIALASIFIGF